MVLNLSGMRYSGLTEIGFLIIKSSVSKLQNNNVKNLTEERSS